MSPKSVEALTKDTLFLAKPPVTRTPILAYSTDEFARKSNFRAASAYCYGVKVVSGLGYRNVFDDRSEAR